jgi:hypothetical protein
MKIYQILVGIFLLFVNISIILADKCFDEMIFDGSEPIVSYGMDTTNHWWAITKPFEGQYRIIIDGKQSQPYLKFKSIVFSPDGKKWAYFAKDNVQWYLVTNDTIKPSGENVGELIFSGNSKKLIYSYFEATNEKIIFDKKQINTRYKVGKIYLNYEGNKIAFKNRIGNRYNLNINGFETTVFDEIIPIGFWCDGRFLYAGKNGNLWEIYRNDELLSEPLSKIHQAQIGINETYAGILAQRPSGDAIAILIDDNYYEPLISKSYDWVGDLILHPTIAMFAYKAKINNSYMIVFNSTELGGGQITGVPNFTYNGEDMFFLGCNIHCFVNVNGRQFQLDNEINVDAIFAKKPGSNTIAYATGSSLIVRYIDRKELVAGMMVDEIIPPRFNWRTNRYEALGRINQRLYLLTCKV